jgi:predicted DNA-binding transcriptional regulator AlpA
MAKRKSDPALAGQLDMFGEWAAPSATLIRPKPVTKKSAPIETPNPANTDLNNNCETAIMPLPANDVVDPIKPEAQARRRGRPSAHKRDLVYHGRALGDLDARALLRAPELAELLGLTQSTLAKLRCSGKGPPFYKLTNQSVGYNQDDVMEWLSKRRRVSTWTREHR